MKPIILVCALAESHIAALKQVIDDDLDAQLRIPALNLTINLRIDGFQED